MKITKPTTPDFDRWARYIGFWIVSAAVVALALVVLIWIVVGLVR